MFYVYRKIYGDPEHTKKDNS